MWRSDSRRKTSTTVSRRRPPPNKPLRLRLKANKKPPTDLGWCHFLQHQKQKTSDKDRLHHAQKQLEQVDSLLEGLSQERCNLRRKRQLRRIRDQIKEKIRVIQSDEEAMELDSRIRPYVRQYTTANDKIDQDILLQDCVQSVLYKTPSVSVVNEEMCPDCKLPMRYNMQQAIMVCSGCGRSESHIDVTSASTQYGDEVEFSTFLYKRATHFNALMQNSQAKGSTTAPMSVMTKIMDQLYKERVGSGDLDTITRDRVRNIIRELKLDNKYYALSIQIACTLNGKAPPRMTPEQEQRLNIMFANIQLPFEKHCPPDRKNFFSYSFCMYKCCELLGYTEFLPLYSLLKGKKKLDKQDEMWKKICDELDWEFKRSVAQKV